MTVRACMPSSTYQAQRLSHSGCFVCSLLLVIDAQVLFYASLPCFLFHVHGCLYNYADGWISAWGLIFCECPVNICLCEILQFVLEPVVLRSPLMTQIWRHWRHTLLETRRESCIMVSIVVTWTCHGVANSVCIGKQLKTSMCSLADCCPIPQARGY